jgi:PKD repeat protein
MKTYILPYFLYFLGIFTFFTACATEESLPVTANFSVEVQNNDYSVPVVVNLTNQSEGAETYNWLLEGSDTSSSSLKNPSVIYTNKGKYKITLKVTNRDGNEDEKSIDFQVDAAMNVDFSWLQVGSAISPVSLQMQDQSLGAISYAWEFENANPATSTEQNPTVVFSSAGEHKIKLTIGNGKETYNIQKSVTVEPALTIDFDWSVAPADLDYEAPVLLQLNNKSINATSYEWSIAGASPNTSVATGPEINFLNAGTYTIQLKATNDKESKTLQKQVVINANNNLYSFTNIKLGINTAHETIGSFFSSVLGKVIKKNEVTSLNGSKIDFAYFGLNSSFSLNQLVSPDELQNTSFTVIPNATHTKIINSQELVATQLLSAGFDAIDTGSDFNGITVSETTTGKTAFDNTITPRVVLFQTQDGRKGAVKIKSFVSDGADSYINVDIKVQKAP